MSLRLTINDIDATNKILNISDIEYYYSLKPSSFTGTTTDISFVYTQTILSEIRDKIFKLYINGMLTSVGFVSYKNISIDMNNKIISVNLLGAISEIKELYFNITTDMFTRATSSRPNITGEYFYILNINQAIQALYAHIDNNSNLPIDFNLNFRGSIITKSRALPLSIGRFLEIINYMSAYSCILNGLTLSQVPIDNHWGIGEENEISYINYDNLIDIKQNSNIDFNIEDNEQNLKIPIAAISFLHPQPGTTYTYLESARGDLELFFNGETDAECLIAYQDNEMPNGYTTSLASYWDRLMSKKKNLDVKEIKVSGIFDYKKRIRLDISSYDKGFPSSTYKTYWVQSAKYNVAENTTDMQIFRLMENL